MTAASASLQPPIAFSTSQVSTCLVCVAMLGQATDRMDVEQVHIVAPRGFVDNCNSPAVHEDPVALPGGRAISIACCLAADANACDIACGALIGLATI